MKVISSSNLKMHDMMNRLSTGSSVIASSSFVPLTRMLDPNHISVTELVHQHLVNKSSITTAAPKFIVGSNSTASSKLEAVPLVKFGDIFVSRFHPQITATQLKTKLFDGMDVSITQMITRHSTYSSFHIRVPAEMLTDVLQPSFWPEGIMVKRFWGRLLPERIANS